MPNFPRQEPDIVALAEAMIAGYTAHPGDFPSADAAALTAALSVQPPIGIHIPPS